MCSVKLASWAMRGGRPNLSVPLPRRPDNLGCRGNRPDTRLLRTAW